MVEFTVPLLVPLAATGNLSSMVVRQAQERAHRVVFSRRTQGRWQDVTAAEFRAEVEAVARGLIAAGIAPGDRVALMSRTRYEWTLVDFAIWTAGAVTVPVYETSSADQVQWILADSGAVAVVVETPAHARTVASVRGQTPALVDVWQIDSAGLDDLVAAGAEVDDELLTTRRTSAGPHDLATIIYTSGTTGRPKGCELTHQNFMALTDNTVARLGEVVSADDASTLLFLPLAHIFARFIQVLSFSAGARVGHSSDVKNLLADLADFTPTYLLSVPRVFEKIYNSSEQKAEAEGKGKIFHLAAETAVAYSKALDAGTVSVSMRLRHAAFDRLVYARIRAAMGGRIRDNVSGGAPLGERLGHFYRGAGISVLEGYGLTETTAPSTVNTPELVKIGTVGLPLPGVSIKVADDGEVLVKGPHVLRGYWRNDEATAEAFVDGWFRTGDLGTLDGDGYLRITGRKKEILVTAGGKNVAPAVLEDRLRAHPLVSQTVVVGDGRPYIGALVTLDADMLPTWLKSNGLAQMGVDEAAGDETVLAEIQRAVDDANTSVSRAESIRRFRLLAVDFTEDSGHLTPSMKLKRSVVMRDFAHEVDELYR